jgi:hypothetical protein
MRLKRCMLGLCSSLLALVLTDHYRVLNMVASTSELTTVLLYFGIVLYWKTYHAKPAPTKPVPKKAWMARAFSAWLSFIVFSPILTGICMCFFAVSFPCVDGDTKNPRCRIDKRLLYVIIAFRVFGV